jgi:hypothetical protein
MRKVMPTYVAFVDLEKDFGNVDWSRMFKTHKESGIKFKERIIYNIYMNHWNNI